MGSLKIELKNGFEFEADTINETRNVNSNARTVTINISAGDVTAAEQHITPDNMSKFTVCQNGARYEYEGYNQNIVTNKALSKTGQALYITAAKIQAAQ